MNHIYKRQYAVLVFFLETVSKIAFLPVYISREAGRSNWQLMIVFLLFDLFLLFGLYIIAKDGKTDRLTNGLKGGIMIFLFGYFALKTVLFAAESAFFLSAKLFDGGYFLFILALLGAVSAYIALKGGRIIARLGELLFFAVAAGFVINLLTTGAAPEFGANLPLFTVGTGKFFHMFIRYSFWTGDLMPLIFFSFKGVKARAIAQNNAPIKADSDKSERKRSDKSNQNIFKKIFNADKIIPITACATALSVLLYTLFLNAVFKADAADVDNTVTALGAFNISNMLIGRADSLALAVWIIPTVFLIAINLFAASEASAYFVKKKKFGAIGVGLLAIILLFFIKNNDALHSFMTGIIGVIMLAVEAAAVLLILIFGRKKRYENKK